MSKAKDKADVWMPLFIGDYLADTTRLTTEQHGAYLLLLMDYWRNGPPPNDDATLAQITRMTAAGWKKARPALLRFFTEVDGLLHQKRIDREIEECQTRKQAAVAKATVAAQKRWGKQSSGDAPSNAPSMPQALPEAVHEGMPGSCPSPSPLPLPTNTEVESVVVSVPKAVGATIPNPPTSEGHWAIHFRHRHGIEINVSSIHERKKAWPIFAGWVNAGLTLERVDAAVAQALANATESIAFLPAYVDRVIASQAAPKQNTTAARDQERADVIATLSGRKPNHECTLDTIDVAAVRIG